MPPDRTFPPQSAPRTPSSDTSHMLPRVSASESESPEHSSAPTPHEGFRIRPVIRTVIVILVLVFGALYFWGAYLNEQGAGASQPAASAVNS